MENSTANCMNTGSEEVKKCDLETHKPKDKNY
jgi:hypothetical protein